MFYQDRSINKLQNSIILLVFQILKIRNIRFVGNLIINNIINNLIINLRSDECRCADHKVTTRMKSDANTTE